MAEISRYEQIRLKNIEENRRMLCQLGLLTDDWKPPKVQIPSIVKKPIVPKRIKTNSDLTYFPSRRSLRKNSLKGDPYDSDLTDSINGEYSESDCSSIKSDSSAKRLKVPNSYGQIEGVEVGDWWETRLECSRAGIHRPTVAGIHPGPEGAYSLALSGGYEDNYDCGDSFTYTGAGGRDLKGSKNNPKNLRTGPQVRDQTLEGSNYSLATSVKTKMPVRVIRGYKSSSEYSPEFGYRYDGLYQVQSYWTAKGQSGHLVYKFALKRCPDQDLPPWSYIISNVSSVGEHHNDISVTDDNLNTISLNPVVQLGEKLKLDEITSLQGKTNNQLSNNVNRVNGKESTDKRVKGVKNLSPCNFRNGNSSELVKDSFRSTTPQKSPKRVRSSLNFSPSKYNDTSIDSSCIYKSPVKMIASNQIDKLDTKEVKSTDLDNQIVECESSTNTPSVHNRSNLKIITEHITENENLSGSNVSHDNYDSIRKSFKTRIDKLIPIKNNLKRSISPDDFGKICDELCKELPKIEKVKRLRFSFENIPDSHPFEFRRKTRTPRKSSLSNKNNLYSLEKRSSFHKYIHICLPEFANDREEFLGWEDLPTEFYGWTEKDVEESKIRAMQFIEVIDKLNNENSSFSSEENGFAGWEDVSHRSLVLNGFLLDKISRDNETCKTDEEETFLGF